VIPQLHQRPLAAKHSRDVVDYMRSLEETRVGTPSIADDDDDNRYIDQQQDVLMHDDNANIEFSDIEEPLMTRTTRSQSRAKENSVPPPTEDISKPLKRNRKKVTEKVPRRRRVKQEEVISDDDD
jgi:hypothetical protein